MASVLSLGVHKPSALPLLASEGILPPDPPIEAYTWQAVSPEESSGHEIDEELVTTQNCVVWSRGGIVQRIFRFDVEKEAITQAVFTRFATHPHGSQQKGRTQPSRSDNNEEYSDRGLKVKKTRSKNANQQPSYLEDVLSAQKPSKPVTKPEDLPSCRALVVVLKTQAHVYLLSQTNHIVHLPFEVDSVFPTFRGVLLQRKFAEISQPRATPNVPPAPTNTFSYSQSSASDAAASYTTLKDVTNRDSLNDPESHFADVVTRLQEDLAKPASAELPRFFCLTDPLAELGTVVSQAGSALKPASDSRRSTSSVFANLDSNEKLLYVSPANEISQGHSERAFATPFILAVTENCNNGTTSLWTISYINQEADPRLSSQPQQAARRASRRRSSFASRLSTGATTPVAKSHRQSSWGPAFENGDLHGSADFLDAAFDNPRAGGRSSRRVSSLLARADLSTNQDRTIFGDLAAGQHLSKSTRRGPSFGTRSSQAAFDHEKSHKETRSSHFGDLHSSLDSVTLQEQPLDAMVADMTDLHDFKAMEDPEPHVDVHGLKREIAFHKVYSVSPDGETAHKSTNSTQNKQPKVFTMQAPLPNLSDPASSRTLTMCVMNRESLELLIFQIHVAPAKATRKHFRSAYPSAEDYITKVTGTRRSGITDACKISQGSTARILVLEAKGSALTLQAPWTALLKVDLPAPLSLHDPFQIINRDSPQKKREGGLKRVISRGASEVISVRSTARQGCVDLGDTSGFQHRMMIQLQPSVSIVSRMMKVCEAVLPSSECGAESILRGWWDAMGWLNARSEDIEHKEWTAILIVLFAMALMFTEDTKAETTPRQRRRRGGLLRSSSGANNDLDSWDEMLRFESGNSVSPQWMDSPAWNWIKSEEIQHSSLAQKKRSSDFASTPAVPLPKQAPQTVSCVSLAREFIKSTTGQAAIGKNGYFPTAASRSPEVRRTALATVLVALHLLREDLKLDALSTNDCHLLTPVLAQLGSWLNWPNWSCQKSSFYMLESEDMAAWLFDQSTMKGMKFPREPFTPPSILKHVEMTITGAKPSFITLLELVGSPQSDQDDTTGMLLRSLSHLTARTLMVTSLLDDRSWDSASNRVLQLEASGLGPSILESFPESVATIFRTIISACQVQPSSAWDAQVLRLVGRDDIAMLHDKAKNPRRAHKQMQHSNTAAARDAHTICNQAAEAENVGAYDGSAEIDRQSVTRLLFKEDQRFAEAVKLVHPLHYPVAQCIPEPGWSEQELLEAQQELAKVVALRTLSVSLGRGLLFYNARLPLLTEKFPIHGFTLSCVMKPSDSTVTADRSVFTEEKVSWAFFHAGVEAGLSISKEAKGVDTSWILFNKPRDLTNRHAGLLLALGLNGHLKCLAKWVAFKYLTPKHNMTSIGLLLGLSASYIGTMDTLVTRLLSVHVTRMLPPGAAELNLSPLTQTCGIMGIGLLYCNTQHRRMTEVMLSEMENVDVEDSANPQDTLRDEGYRLSAGFALGYINLGRGNDLKGLHDMHITERLLTLAIASKRVDQAHVADKATAGATIAIALIFMKTNDRTLARKIDVPETTNQCDYVRPDHFLLRTVAKHLIMWDHIRAEQAWVAAQLPSMYERKMISKVRSLTTENLPLFNILAGLCLAIGLRYAGTGDTVVRDLLCSYLDHFVRVCRLPALSYDAKLARITVRNCQDVLALSISCVMAGTGDLMVLRRLRLLHGRTDAETSYGSHLAAHFAVGVLFLGGGTHTFGTSNLAIASLLCAFYPLFPATVLDNKSHLQAFRHFWVLATERRCLIPRDIDTHRPLTLPFVVSHTSGTSSRLTAPCLLPDLGTISKIQTADPHYWPVTLDLGSDSSHFSAFRRDQSIYVRRRDAYSASQTSVFSATMQALNDTQTAHQLRSQPFEWLFTLHAFQDFDRTERALVLPTTQADLMSSLFQGVRGTVVDDRLAVETGCLGDRRSERLWNLRLLLKYAEESEKRGEDMGWLGRKVIESLKARLVLWTRDAS